MVDRASLCMILMHDPVPYACSMCMFLMHVVCILMHPYAGEAPMDGISLAALFGRAPPAQVRRQKAVPSLMRCLPCAHPCLPPRSPRCPPCRLLSVLLSCCPPPPLCSSIGRRLPRPLPRRHLNPHAVMTGGVSPRLDPVAPRSSRTCCSSSPAARSKRPTRPTCGRSAHLVFTPCISPPSALPFLVRPLPFCRLRMLSSRVVGPASAVPKMERLGTH